MIFEVQLIVSVCVSGEPVLAVILLAQGLEFGELLILALLLVSDSLTVRLHNLEIAVVHPNLPLKKALAGRKLLRLYGENIARDFIRVLLTNVADVVQRQLIGGQCEGLSIL